MIAVRNDLPRFTPEEYFAWEEQQLERHEYIGGEVYAMTGGNLNHSDVAGNLLILLKTHLRSSGCKAFNSDARINIVGSTDYTYPDISVTCDNRDKATTQYITYPCLIVEVLSPSTASYDRGDKFTMYRRNPVLQDYLLVSTDKMSIDLFHKDQQGKWDIFNYQAGDLVELASIDLVLPIEDVYQEIIFEPTESL
jgi:Uma2 family endonuclease